MESSIDLQAGLTALQQILDERPETSAEWNEAQNRFHFVDRLLKECLGWTHPYMEVEEKDTAGGFADYLLGRPTIAILEAKRESVLFQIPPSINTKKARKISALLLSCEKFKAAFNQIVPYCALNGAQLGIICNGPQLIIFRSLTPGQKPSEGLCYVFDGLASYVAEFSMLWGLLSPEGIALNRARNLLANDGNLRLPPKASTHLSEPNRHRYRTPFQENLRTLATVLLDTIEDNEDISDQFDRECYVTTAANKRHLLLSKNAIESRYARASLNGVETQDLRAEDGRFSQNVLLAGRSSRPVVVLGDVGVGKTSFFKHVFKGIDISPQSSSIYLRIDLGKRATLENDFRRFMLAEIPRRLSAEYEINIFNREFIRNIYKREIVDFDESPDGELKFTNQNEYNIRLINFLNQLTSDGSHHLLRSLEFLTKKLGKTIFLLIDNADQRDYQTQEQAFLASAEFAETNNVLVFISLRPSTFYKSKVSGALSGYETKVFTIAPPPAEDVIQKRLAFGLRIAEGRTTLDSLNDVRLNLSSIILFLKATLRAIKSNQEIRTFLSNITGGNTRLVIELITSFVGSPNVDSEKIVEKEGASGNYKVPLHEFTKHALLGEYAYFNPASSLVAHNIFDVSSADPREHFLKSLMIAFLSSGQASKDRDGYVNGADLQIEMRRLGFLDHQTNKALSELCFSRLLETPHGHFREVDVGHDFDPSILFYKASSIGVYHIRYWCGSFSFLDATATDTPIFDEVSRIHIFERADSFRISSRYEKSQCFAEYLTSVWFDSKFEANYYDFPQILNSQIASFDGVALFLKRYGDN